jgi:hypothetical protein
MHEAQQGKEDVLLFFVQTGFRLDAAILSQVPREPRLMHRVP